MGDSAPAPAPETSKVNDCKYPYDQPSSDSELEEKLGSCANQGPVKEYQTCPSCCKSFKNVLLHIDKKIQCQEKISGNELENLKKQQENKRTIKNRAYKAN